MHPYSRTYRYSRSTSQPHMPCLSFRSSRNLLVFFSRSAIPKAHGYIARHSTGITHHAHTHHAVVDGAEQRDRRVKLTHTPGYVSYTWKCGSLSFIFTRGPSSGQFPKVSEIAVNQPWQSYQRGIHNGKRTITKTKPRRIERRCCFFYEEEPRYGHGNSPLCFKNKFPWPYRCSYFVKIPVAKFPWPYRGSYLVKIHL